MFGMSVALVKQLDIYILDYFGAAEHVQAPAPPRGQLLTCERRQRWGEDVPSILFGECGYADPRYSERILGIPNEPVAMQLCVHFRQPLLRSPLPC